MPAEPAPPRRNGPAALLALLAIFAAVCALFSGAITTRDWIVDRAHARWPITTATIERSAIDSERPFSRDGGGTVWYVDVGLRLPNAGPPTHAHIMSASTREQAGSREMQAWVARHPAGSTLTVRIDPASDTRAELLDNEGLIMERHMSSDLVLTGGALFVAISATLGSLALRRRTTA